MFDNFVNKLTCVLNERHDNSDSGLFRYGCGIHRRKMGSSGEGA